MPRHYSSTKGHAVCVYSVDMDQRRNIVYQEMLIYATLVHFFEYLPIVWCTTIVIQCVIFNLGTCRASVYNNSVKPDLEHNLLPNTEFYRYQ